MDMDVITAVASGDQQHIQLPIEGITCATCAGRVEKALNRMPGVESSVNLVSATADIRYALAQFTPEQLAEAIERASYDVPHERRELAIGGTTCATCVAGSRRPCRRCPGCCMSR